MSTQITRKSAGEPASPARLTPAVSLAQARWPAYSPSHGRAADPLPHPPAGLVDLGPADALRVRGPDRESWLQGMTTADVRGADFGGAVYGAFLGGKGRLVADGLVFRRAEDLLVVLPAGRADAVHQHLDKLLIMEDAELSRAEGLHHLRWCPGAPLPAGLPEVTGGMLALGLELLLPRAVAADLLARVPRADPALVEQHRVALGVPAWGRDLDEESTPVEAGLDRALSFTKGCYVGQEVVAMATYRGRVAWNLVRLEVDGPPPSPGSLLDPQRPGRRGKVTSSAALPGGLRAALLGIVHKEQIVPGAKVALEDGRQAEVLGLPYEARPGAGVCA